MTTLKQFIAELPEDRQPRIRQRTQELIAEEMSLRDLHHTRQFTQPHVANELGIKDRNVSRIE